MMEKIMSFTRRHFFLASSVSVAWAGLGLHSYAQTPEKLPVVTSFSILADMVGRVGGDRIAVSSLVGPDIDAHGYQPTPADAKAMAGAKLIVFNGLGFEGWMDRLVKSSGSKAPLVLATKAVKPRKVAGGHGHDHGHSHAHDHGEFDPHAWHDLDNARLYVAAIRDGLINADPAGKAVYEANAEAYDKEIAALATQVKARMAALPPERRKIITTHDAFGYFAAAYSLSVITPRGIKNDAEPTAKALANVIRQIKSQKIPAVFMENIADQRSLDQIIRETGAKIGGKLYSDALSGPTGPAPTYLDLIRHNVNVLSQALSV
jgi:zinc/manganese transport system substrate-binding protein